MRDKIFASLLRRTDRILEILWCPMGGKLGDREWWPDWVYRIQLVPRWLMLMPWRWAMLHGWHEDGEYKRATDS